jgi:hypothetical protein
MTTGNLDENHDMNEADVELPVDPFLNKEVLPEPSITPDYLRDEKPDTDSELDYVKWCLMHTFNESNMISDGHPQKVIDKAAFELERDGYRQRPSKKQILETFLTQTSDDTEEDPDDKGKGKGREKKMTVKEKTVTISERSAGRGAIKSFAKGAPAEVILDNIQLPPEMDPRFASGMKFGASMVIMGVRIGQDLAAAGIQYAKPLIELAKDMRAGEVAAAEMASTDAAHDAAQEAAGVVMEQVSPYLIKLKELEEKEAERATPTASNGEMRGMMMEMMKPLLKRITNKLTHVPEGTDLEAVPDGWTVEKKKE